MLKYRQVPVHITHLSVSGFYCDPTVNLGHPGWKDWQLHLWHAFSYQPIATHATIFRLILISSIAGKTPARSGGLTLPALADSLSRDVDRPVFDKTGLTARYDIHLNWSAYSSNKPGDPEQFGPSVFTALEQQLGLRLDPRTGPVEMFIVESIERVPPEGAPAQ